ncbi:hypothetical protein C2S52_004162 [Perilla frutescens var. hirtella]|nr:hypothetical protein C2S52_004162 [Perilla frutescens var. hirtella]
MPPRRSSNHIPSSPIADEQLESPMKQGIVTILGADCDRNTKAGSLRRTLSADMSSKKWLEQNGFFSPMKKINVSSRVIASTAADHSSSSSESEEEFDENPNQDEVWRSIQAQKERNHELQKRPAQNEVWSSLILTQKSDNSLLPPPYVPPPVKRSASCLSEKSLEICTESLGSETGSDGFSCYGDEERDQDKSPFAAADHLHAVKYNKSPPRPFPPPLPSIAGGDGGSLHMQSHRENGRLVVEAVSVAPRKYFHAQRQDGRLLLSLMHGPSILQVEEEEKKVEFEKVFDEMEEEGVGGGEKEELIVVEQNLSLPTGTGMISVHKSGLVMKKLMAVGNINPKWSKKINMPTDDDDHVFVTGEEELPIPQSLPPRPPVARLIAPPPPPAAASFNAYEYFWRSKPAVTGGLMNPVMMSSRNKINQDLVVMKASKTEQFEPYMRGCKEARRSLIWEPYCIATS